MWGKSGLSSLLFSLCVWNMITGYQKVESQISAKCKPFYICIENTCFKLWGDSVLYEYTGVRVRGVTYDVKSGVCWCVNSEHSLGHSWVWRPQQTSNLAPTCSCVGNRTQHLCCCIERNNSVQSVGDTPKNTPNGPMCVGNFTRCFTRRGVT